MSFLSLKGSGQSSSTEMSSVAVASGSLSNFSLGFVGVESVGIDYLWSYITFNFSSISCLFFWIRFIVLDLVWSYWNYLIGSGLSIPSSAYSSVTSVISFFRASTYGFGSSISGSGSGIAYFLFSIYWAITLSLSYLVSNTVKSKKYAAYGTTGPTYSISGSSSPSELYPSII